MHVQENHFNCTARNRNNILALLFCCTLTAIHASIKEIQIKYVILQEIQRRNYNITLLWSILSASMHATQTRQSRNHSLLNDLPISKKLKTEHNTPRMFYECKGQHIYFNTCTYQYANQQRLRLDLPATVINLSFNPSRQYFFQRGKHRKYFPLSKTINNIRNVCGGPLEDQQPSNPPREAV